MATDEEQCAGISIPVPTPIIPDAVGLQEAKQQQIENLVASADRAYHQVLLHKQRTISKGGSLPGLYKGQDGVTVYLPDSFQQEDCYAAMAIVRLCTMLKYRMELIPYNGNLRDTSRDELAEGILLGCGDYSTNVTIKPQKSDLELGRRIVRAQQLIRIFSTKPLVLDLLQKNQYFFGNDRRAVMEVNNTKVPVVPVIKTLGSLFREATWENTLRSLLVRLLRESSVFIQGQTRVDAIRSHLVSFENYVGQFCSRSITLTPAMGRRKAQKIERVPAMPNYSHLFTNEENK
jgi:hypothetical protein